VASFSADPVRNFFPQYFDLAWSLEEAEEFFVGAGEETPGIDAELEAGVEIEGTVTEAGTGLPLAGIRVCAFDAELGGEEGCVFSGSDGSYEIRELFPWKYVVGFSVGRSGVFSGEDAFVRQYYEDKSSFAEANVIEAFEPGFYQDIDAHLIRGPEIFPTKTTATAPPAPLPVKSAPELVQPQPRSLTCPKSKRKKMVKGKQRCVRVKKRAHHRKGQGKKGAPRPAGSR
jgi:hypothetical protein